MADIVKKIIEKYTKNETLPFMRKGYKEKNWKAEEVPIQFFSSLALAKEILNSNNIKINPVAEKYAVASALQEGGGVGAAIRDDFGMNRTAMELFEGTNVNSNSEKDMWLKFASVKEIPFIQQEFISNEKDPYYDTSYKSVSANYRRLDTAIKYLLFYDHKTGDYANSVGRNTDELDRISTYIGSGDSAKIRAMEVQQRLADINMPENREFKIKVDNIFDEVKREFDTSNKRFGVLNKLMNK